MEQGRIFEQTAVPWMFAEAEKGNKHISFRLTRGCAPGQQML